MHVYIKQIIYTSLSLSLIGISCSSEDPILSNSENNCLLDNEEENLVREFSGFAHVFQDSDPTKIDKSLDPLITYLGNAKIVGLGEGTHGTKEFYDMKHKLYRHLGLEKGFKAIVFEIPWGNALVVNDYVLNDVGDADEVINQTWYWTYDTEEVRELVRWMHDYNLDKSTEDKIYFVGCDPQGPDFKLEEKLVREYVLSIFPDSAFFISSAYQSLPIGNLSSYADDDQFIHNSNISGIQSVLQLFENQKEIFITNSSLFEYEVARMAAHLIKERERIYRIQQFGAPRDSLMAFYALWWSRILGEDAQIATWAHNLHVMDGGSFNSALMGTVLKDELDNDYINVGFSFSKGSLNAFLADRTRNAIGGTRRQTLAKPVCNSTNQLLYEVDGDQQYYIFDELGGEAATYFNNPNPFMQCGAGFNPIYVQNYVQNFPLSQSLDVLIHFDETTASELK
tara:strand:+ start:445 stop:1803 length:1359 start_codon:yes stop_codon:yes gene_type:complete